MKAVTIKIKGLKLSLLFMGSRDFTLTQCDPPAEAGHQHIPG